MDSLCFDGNKEETEEKSANISGVDDELGDSEVTPRVGHEYQAEIPSLIAAPYLSQLVKKARYSEITANMLESFSLGSPIPLLWAHCKFDSNCGYGTLESVTSEEKLVLSENECAKLKLEVQNALLGEGKNLEGFSNFQPFTKGTEKDIDLYPELKTVLDQPKGKYLLPGLLRDQSWTDVEYDSFLLSLYVFGKNLKLLKRFVGSKGMGDILYFYYGKFYKSKDYCRWSKCRKLKTRRCIFGEKIFTGWRQQELLSRLFSRVPGDCHTMLVEISKNFVEGKMPFEDYVFALKNAVGIELLIAAVGIGKGKQDLTGNAVEPTKTIHVSVRSEIPVGKACSSLTPADIIKFLTGNFRLSKARSNDLFWEAVWPRLLAKGWHSEQPKDNVSGSKLSLVFLVPGVKKFSRRRLVKGNHYFDSISDVLNKVASDPGLLETQTQAIEDRIDRENRQEKQGLNGVSNGQQFHYLQSHSSKHNQDVTKFTIVDTSMDQCKVRQMRGLPFQTTSTSTISSCSSESEEDTSDDAEDQAQQTHPSSRSEDQAELAHVSSRTKDQAEQAHFLSCIEDQGEQAHAMSCIEDQGEQAHASSRIEDQVELINSSYPLEYQVEQANSSNPIEDQVEQANSSNHPIEDQVEQGNSSNPIEEFSDKGLRIDSSDCSHIPEGLNATKVEVENHKFHSDLHNGEHSREIKEHHSIQKMTSDCMEYFSSTTTMQNLRACNNLEFSHSIENTSMHRNFDLNEPISPSNMHEASEGITISAGFENLASPSYPAKGSPNISNEGSATENPLAGEVLAAEKSETVVLIDLNFPRVSPDLGVEMEIEMPSSVVKLQNDSQDANSLSSPPEIIDLNVVQEFHDENNEQQPFIVNRRQSTRNRPLTTKALEALEYRFLNSKRKRKNTESSDNDSKSQCFGVSDGRIISASSDNGIRDSMADTKEEEENVIRGYSCSINLNISPL